MVDRSGGAIRASRFRPFLRRLASAADAPRGTLTVLFCGDEEIAALNGRWRGKPRPTDVLSFPGGGASASGGAHLGDVAISVPTAARAARGRGRALDREIEMLLAHGLLHALGYDHETDDGTMLRLQSRILREARAPRRELAAGRDARGSRTRSGGRLVPVRRRARRRTGGR